VLELKISQTKGINIMTIVKFPSLKEQQSIKQLESVFVRGSLLPHRWDCFWLIKSGAVRTFSWLDDGTIIVFGLWGSGDILSPLLSKADPFKMECLTTVKAIPVSIYDVYDINQALIAQTQQLQELIAIKHYRPIREALQQFLIWLGKKFGTEKDGGKLIDLRLTHQEIAEILGITRVSVTRLLTMFEKKGLIKRPSQQTIILYEPTWYYTI
jgi:CRP-like cAMP-binding protein